MAWGQQFIETGLTSIFNAGTAIFGVLVAAAVFADERLTPRKALGVAIAFFHVGVEQHWWRGTADCHAPVIDPNLSVDALRQQLLNTDFVPCDQIPWSLFGISMAGYNTAAYLVLALAAIWAARALKGRRTA